MLDIHFIREHADEVRRAIELKQVDLDLDALLAEDRDVVRRRQQLDELNRDRNANAKRVASATAGEREELITHGRALGGEIRGVEQSLREAEARLAALLLLVPNIPDPAAPIGGEDAAVEVRRWGTPREKTEALRDQVELLELNGWAEWERPSRIAGARNYMLKGAAVLLEMALWRLALDVLVSRGMTVVTVPSMARESAFTGTGHFPERTRPGLLPARGRSLSVGHCRGPCERAALGRDPGRRRAADPLRRLLALLSPGGRQRRP